MAICGWCRASGLKLVPNPEKNEYPTALESHGTPSSGSHKACQGPSTWLSMGEAEAAKSRGVLS